MEKFDFFEPGDLISWNTMFYDNVKGIVLKHNDDVLFVFVIKTLRIENFSEYAKIDCLFKKCI